MMYHMCALTAVLLALTSGAQAQSCSSTIQLSTASSILTVMKNLDKDVAALKQLTGTSKTRLDDLYATVVAQSPIKWTGLSCAKTGDDGSIVKVGCGNGWNGGAISTRGAFGDAFVQFRCTKTQHTMLGLSIGNSHSSYTDIDCALYCDQGNARVYERGASTASIGKYDDNTVFAVKRKGSTVTYNMNGKSVRTCRYKLMGRMLVDLSIHNTGKGGILAASWVGEVEPIPTSPVQWTGLGCSSVSISGMLTKSSNCGNGWNGGAVSVMGAYSDIDLQFRCTKAQHSMIGLASPSKSAFSSQTYTTIDCAMYCDQGTLRMYEKGSNKQNSARYEEQDLLSVKRIGSTITYWQNGVLKRTCGNRLSGYIMADVAIHNAGRGGILEAFWVGTVAPQPVAPPPPPAPTLGAIKWRSTASVSLGAYGRMYKTGRTGWSGGGVSTRSVSGAASFTFRCTRTQYSMIGFAIGDSSKSYNDIDCAIYCGHGNIYTYELGRYTGRHVAYSDATWITGNRLSNGDVQMKVGSRVYNTCTRTRGRTVNLDTSIYMQNRGGIIESKWVS